MMPVDVDKITPVDFCILVAWLHGCSIGQISMTIGKAKAKSAASIRGIVNKKMSTPRSAMSLKERQDALNSLKDRRIDDDLMPERYFTAIPLKAKSHIKPLSAYKKEKPRPPVFDNTPKGRRAKKQHLKNEKRKIVEAELLRLKAQNGLNESRGINAAAFEYMLAKGLLADPREKERGSVKETPSEMRRNQAGLYFRKILSDVQFSQLKSQDFESAGGGSGMGVAIPARISEATSVLRALKSIMSVEDLTAIESVVVYDKFIWLDVKSEIAMNIRLEDIRRALDCVAVLMRMFPDESFRARWGYLPNKAPQVKTRAQARRETNAVRDMIMGAQRMMK